MNQTMEPGIGFALAALMFGVGMIGAGLLMFSTLVIGYRVRKSEGQPVLVDINALAGQRMILNASLALLLLIECATLLWDHLTVCRHFPIEIRWPVDLLVCIGVVISGIKLLRLYLQAWHDRKTA